MTQNEMILKHLREYGSITQLQAFYFYGCTRLSARIAELKMMGYEIACTRIEKKNRFGEKTWFAEYRLKETDNGRAQDVR